MAETQKETNSWDATIKSLATDNCDERNEASCCVALFISRVRTLEGQSWGDKNQLELIFAVHTPDSCGLFPGLTSNIGVNVKAGWTPANAPIGKYCVPCNGCKTVNLLAEAMEVETMAAGGRPEFGSSSGSISLNCKCDIAPVRIAIALKGGGVGKGVVEVEISARRVTGGCC